MRRATIAAALALTAAACGGGPAPLPSGSGEITVYSGREKELIEPLLARARSATGVTVNVRYGDSAELAALLLEEGKRSPADVFFAQDAGALGAVGSLLEQLPSPVIDRVPERFRADDGTWVGVSGRARAIVYNTQRVPETALPRSVLDLTDPRWNGRVGWAPQNASFQAFVTGLRALRGDAAARAWLRGMRANGTRDYPKNTPIVEAVGSAEIDLGLVNHYYLVRMKKESPSMQAANHFLEGGDPGALVNVAGAGVLATSDNLDGARAFVGYLVSAEAQRYFAEETFEYPLARGVTAPAGVPALDALEPPDLDLSRLADLEETLVMLREEGLL